MSIRGLSATPTAGAAMAEGMPSTTALPVPHAALRQESEGLKISATTRIQSIWRGHHAKIEAGKARRHFLSYALLEKAKHYIDIRENLEGIPRASSGNTAVYLPEGLPIVLKESGSPANQSRFTQMKQARAICEKSDYRSLVIPGARVHGNFIVETRLPITMHGTKEQIGLYVENRDRFTGAVEEFVGFLCQSRLDDIVGGNNDPYEILSGLPVGRYDNIALYLEEDQGKIGLIDLEGFSPERPKWPPFHAFSVCCNAVHLFPYHLDEIMSVAKKFNPEIEIYRKDVERASDDALKLFKISYEDHLQFVKKKGIRLEDPTSFKKLDIARVEELKKVIEEALGKEHAGFYFKGCLGDLPAATLISFNETAFPRILEATYKLINDLLESNLAYKIDKVGIFTNPQLLSLRTLNFGNGLTAQEEFIESTSKSLEMLNFKNRYEVRPFLNLLLGIIFKELEKGEEIASYIAKFDYRGNSCIFC